ncbi:MAG: gamma-glutamyltransferase [Woeseiaceae bacterium]
MQPRLLLVFLACSLLPATMAHAQALASYDQIHHPVYSRTGMVASQNRVPSEIGAQILADGGNAIDAAVAVGFSLAVTLPRAGNIAGGGYMLYHDAESGKTIAIDYREMAPLGATRDMFLDSEGNADRSLAKDSLLSSGVPGTVAGFHLAHQKFGRLPWSKVLEPAIALARDGIVVTRDLSNQLKSAQQRNCRDATTCAYLYKKDGEPYEMGERLVQSDLAHTLQLIADDGPDAFYRGKIAEKIIAKMERGGGLIDKASLAAYKPEIREPIRGHYRGYEIVAMPLTSSGGVHVIQMLNILQHFDITEMGAGSADAIHVLAEVMRLAYADRSEHLADPDFYDVPVAWLTSEEYASELAVEVDMEKATASAQVLAGEPVADESRDTTHFSVMDVDGNVVSNTYTLNTSYGSGIAVDGAGFVLNNEMDDFVSKPGVPNVYGLLGGEANAVAPNKRPLSSMTPVIVFDAGEPWFATGSPGGGWIITAVLQMIVNVIDHGMGIADASDAPRLHHQWYPDQLLLEDGFSPDTVRELESRGHEIARRRSIFTSLQTVAFKDGWFRGASDPRRQDSAAVAPPEPDANQD